MRLSHAPLSLSLFAGLVLTTLPAHATLISYTDPAAFAAALSAMTTIGFEGIAGTNSFANENTSTGLTISGVNFTGKLTTGSYDLQVVDGGFASPYYNFGSGASLKSPSYNAVSSFVPYIHVVLPASVTGFGVDLMTISPNAVTYQATVGSTIFTVATANRPTRTFFGVTSDTPIAFVDLALTGTTNGAGTYGLIDNVQFGATAPEATAEAATLLLIGSGLAALGFFRKRLQAFATA